jgi:hypothetical protein
MLVGLFLVGCSDFLDVNDNPNYPTKIEDYLIIPASQASIASVMSADYGLVGGFWSQYWAQSNTSSQYKVLETYSLSSNSNNVNGSYLELFTGGLSDNEILCVKSKKEKNWSLYLMSSVMKAYGFQYLVDLYGNVPYKEAFKGEDNNFSPKIDKGEDIYVDIYNLLNEALKNIKDNNVKGFDNRYLECDLLLQGDVDEWVRFANTLKVKILLRQYYVKTSWVTQELTKLLPSNNFLTKDVSLVNFEDVDSKSNPLYEADQRQLNTKANIRANATFTSYLKDNADTRIDKLFEKVNDEILGMITGSYEIPVSKWNANDIISKPILTPTMPVHLMTLSESYLLLSEAYIRIGDYANAKQYYDKGVLESFARMELDGSSFVASGGVYEFPSSGVENQIKAIIMQKWVDAADGQRGCESFIEQVRTGYPEVAKQDIQDEIVEGNENDLPLGYVPGTLIYSKKGNTGGQFPKRLPYADCELNYNANAVDYRGLSDMQVMLSNVWWKQ